MKKLILIFIALLFSLSIGSNSLDYKYMEKKHVKYVSVYTNIIGTVYHPVKRQTDKTPYLTADHSKINPQKINELRWVALSRDLINHKDQWRDWNGKISFGDTIIIESPHPEINGEWVVHDTMNKRYTNRIDFLQSTDGLYNKWTNIIIKKKETISNIININS